MGESQGEDDSGGLRSPPSNPAPVGPEVDGRREAFTRGAELGPAAATLRAARHDILYRWLETARDQPFHASQPDGAIADHIPKLFDALVDFLERSAPFANDPQAPLGDAHISEIARAHARARFAQGLAAADVLTEFRILRQEIGRALRERSTGGGDLLAAELLVHDALDGAATLGVAALEAHEAERRRLRAELAAIVDSSDDAIWSMTLDGTIASWNPGAQRLYGYTAEEAIGRSMDLVVPPERLNGLRSALERAGRGERIEPHETERQRKDGTHVLVSVTISPIRDSFGTIIGASAIARDITEPKRIEQKLRLHSVLVEAAHEAIFAWHPDEGITFWSRGAQEQYGWTAAEALGKGSHDLLDTPSEQVDTFTAALHRDGRWQGELSHTTKNGRRLTVEARVAQVDGDGRRYIVEATRDVTEQRRAEAARRASDARSTFLAEAGRVLGSSLEYAHTLASVADLAVPHVADWCAVDLLDESGRLQRLAVAHRDPQKVRLAQQLQERYPPDPRAARGPWKVVRTGKSELVADIPDATLERTTRDEADLALFRGLGMRSYMAAPVRARDDILGVISFVSAESGRRFDSDDLGLAEDLARRAGVAIENARLYREAQEQVALREQLLRVVAHDLRVPLTAIKGTADLLQRQAMTGRLDPDRLVEQTARISHAAAGMAANISELLDTARLRAGLPLELHTQRADLVKIAYQVASQVQIGAPRHTINVESAVPELFGEWDASRLERVLGNLLANSIKYSPEGSQVTVDIHREEGARGAWACVAVRDRGIGIPASDLGRIFESYHRAANVLGKFPGEGIGLNGARHIVELHGGSIQVASEEGKGSTFTLRLPL